MSTPLDPRYYAPTTCWKVWLKRKAEICPFLPDKRDIFPNIEFLELVSAAGHSYIFKVRHEDKICALKLHMLLQPHWGPSIKVFEDYAIKQDPFMVESQVYDYLIEGKQVGKVGPYCYGWLAMSKEQEMELTKSVKSWPLDWRRRVDTESDPICGLLLEYIDGCVLDKACLTPPAAQSLRDQLNHLHSLYIAHGDFYSRNMMVSKTGRAYLIDFSAAYLWPVRGLLRKKEDFLSYIKDERHILELFLFRLQNLKRHEGMIFSHAQSEEEAYGCPPPDYADPYEILECDV